LAPTNVMQLALSPAVTSLANRPGFPHSRE
jgi:hypothetical protein